MRVISGKFKGRKLKFVSNQCLRPTASMVREAFFTKINTNITDKKFLDLFAGTGSVGIEALSRGAKKVFFVDKNYSAIKLIKENLLICKADPLNYEVINCDFKSALYRINEKFDFIYVDPPYKSEFYEIVSKIINEKQLLSNEGLLICEHETANPLFLKDFILISQKKYGIKTLSYFILDKEPQNLLNSY